MASPTKRAAPSITQQGHHSDEEMKVLRAIVAREEGLDQLLLYCCNFEQECSVDLLEAILRVRQLSLAVVDAIAGWRRRMVQKKPFLWRNLNYLLKMCCDLDFVCRSQGVLAAMDGVRLVKRNPFLTMGGLDQSMRVLWARELPEEDDLPVLLDSTVLAVGVTIDEPCRIRVAEQFLLLEERRYGKLSKTDALQDHRVTTLIQKEAEFASKARFGLVSRAGTSETLL